MQSIRKSVAIVANKLTSRDNDQYISSGYININIIVNFIITIINLLKSRI